MFKGFFGFETDSFSAAGRVQKNFVESFLESSKELSVVIADSDVFTSHPFDIRDELRSPLPIEFICDDEAIRVIFA